jgi:hypothetical protein
MNDDTQTIIVSRYRDWIPPFIAGLAVAWVSLALTLFVVATVTDASYKTNPTKTKPKPVPTDESGVAVAGTTNFVVNGAYKAWKS